MNVKMIGHYLLQQLNELRLSSTMCDLELISKDWQSFPVHHIVFVSLNKRHFENAKNTHPTLHHTTSRILLSQVSTEELDILVQFMYGIKLRRKSRYEILVAALGKLNMGYLLQEAGGFTLEPEELLDAIKKEENCETGIAQDTSTSERISEEHVNKSFNGVEHLESTQSPVLSCLEKNLVSSSGQIANVGSNCEEENSLDVCSTSEVHNSSPNHLELDFAKVKHEIIEEVEDESTSSNDLLDKTFIYPIESNTSFVDKTDIESDRDGSLIETDILNTSVDGEDDGSELGGAVAVVDNFVDELRSDNSSNLFEKFRDILSKASRSENVTITDKDSTDLQKDSQTSKTNVMDSCDTNVFGSKHVGDIEQFNQFVKDVKDKINVIMGATGYIQKKLSDLENPKEVSESLQGGSREASSQCMQGNHRNIHEETLISQTSTCDSDKDSENVTSELTCNEEPVSERPMPCLSSDCYSHENTSEMSTPVSVKSNISSRTPALRELSFKSLLSRPSDSLTSPTATGGKLNITKKHEHHVEKKNCTHEKQNRAEQFFQQQRKLLPKPHWDFYVDQIIKCKEISTFKNKQKQIRSPKKKDLICKRAINSPHSEVELYRDKSKEQLFLDQESSTSILHNTDLDSIPNDPESPQTNITNLMTNDTQSSSQTKAETYKPSSVNESNGGTIVQARCLDSQNNTFQKTIKRTVNTSMMVGDVENIDRTMPESQLTSRKETRTAEYPVLHKMLSPCPVVSKPVSTDRSVNVTSRPTSLLDYKAISSLVEKHGKKKGTHCNEYCSLNGPKQTNERSEMTKIKIPRTEQSLRKTERPSFKNGAKTITLPIPAHNEEGAQVACTRNERLILPKGIVLKSCPVTVQMTGSNEVIIVPVSNNTNTTYSGDTEHPSKSESRKRHKSMSNLISSHGKPAKKRKSLGIIQPKIFNEFESASETVPQSFQAHTDKQVKNSGQFVQQKPVENQYHDNGKNDSKEVQVGVEDRVVGNKCQLPIGIVQNNKECQLNSGTSLNEGSFDECSMSCNRKLEMEHCLVNTVQRSEMRKTGLNGPISTSKCTSETEILHKVNNVPMLKNEGEKDNPNKSPTYCLSKNNRKLSMSAIEQNINAVKCSKDGLDRDIDIADEEIEIVTYLTSLGNKDNDERVTKNDVTSAMGISELEPQALKSPEIARLLQMKVTPSRSETFKSKDKIRKRSKENGKRKKTSSSAGIVKESNCSENLNQTPTISGDNPTPEHFQNNIAQMGQIYQLPSSGRVCHISDLTCSTMDTNKLLETQYPGFVSKPKRIETHEHCSVTKKIKMNKRLIKPKCIKKHLSCAPNNMRSGEVVNGIGKAYRNEGNTEQTSAIFNKIDKLTNNDSIDNVVVLDIDEGLKVCRKNMFSDNTMSKENDSEDEDLDIPLIHLKMAASKQLEQSSNLSDAPAN